MKRAWSFAVVPYLASTLLATAFTRPGSADAPPPSSEARAMAETLFFTGRGLMEAKRYEEACVKFAESYRLDAAAGTLLNLAVCHEKIGKIASAWGEFKQALADAKKAGREDRQQLATEHIETLEPDLPYMTIHVPPTVRVPGLEVVRNGSVLTQGGWDAELPVDPGKVEIVTRAPGYKPRTKTVAVAKKQHLEVTIEALEKAPEPLRVVSDPGWSGERKSGFALIGLGIVGLGVGGYFGIRTIQEKAASDKACPIFDDERRCTTIGADKMDAARRDAWISNIGLGVGLGSLAVGTYLFIHGARKVPSDAAPKTVASSLRWSIGPTRDGVSGVLVGAF
jgi:tetratricopeptide (TPR) repeat protein